MKLFVTALLLTVHSLSYSQTLESYRSEAETKAHRNLEGANLDKRVEINTGSYRSSGLRPATPVEIARNNTKRQVHEIISAPATTKQSHITRRR